MNTDPRPATGAPSAATHECPGGCGERLPSHLFACTKCWRLLPHDLRQALVRTRPLKYLDAERLQAIHEAEDYLEHLAAVELGWEPAAPPEQRDDAITKATHAALQKSERNDALGQACAIAYAQRQGQLPNTRPAAQRVGKGKR